MYNNNYSNDQKHANHLGGILITEMKDIMNDNIEIIHSETLDGEVSLLLDQYSGIDAVYKFKNDLGGIALRAQQHSDKNWETFTVRYSRSTGTETSYAKRMRQIYNSHPTFWPHITVQGYFDNNEVFLGGGMCYTKEIYDLLKGYDQFTSNKKDGVYLQTNSDDGNEFLVIPFEMVDTRVLEANTNIKFSTN